MQKNQQTTPPKKQKENTNQPKKPKQTKQKTPPPLKQTGGGGLDFEYSGGSETLDSVKVKNCRQRRWQQQQVNLSLQMS